MPYISRNFKPVNRNFCIKFATEHSVTKSVDNACREISSLIWGRGPSSDTIFAGTESDEFANPMTTGVQAAFLIRPTGEIVRRMYTNCRDEVEELAINPAGAI